MAANKPVAIPIGYLARHWFNFSSDYINQLPDAVDYRTKHVERQLLAENRRLSCVRLQHLCQGSSEIMVESTGIPIRTDRARTHARIGRETTCGETSSWIRYRQPKEARPIVKPSQLQRFQILQVDRERSASVSSSSRRRAVNTRNRVRVNLFDIQDRPAPAKSSNYADAYLTFGSTLRDDVRRF